MPETISQMAKTMATTRTVFPGHTSAATPTIRLKHPGEQQHPPVATDGGHHVVGGFLHDDGFTVGHMHPPDASRRGVSPRDAPMLGALERITGDLEPISVDIPC
jgi:hypothetical protein